MLIFGTTYRLTESGQSFCLFGAERSLASTLFDKLFRAIDFHAIDQIIINRGVLLVIYQ